MPKTLDDLAWPRHTERLTLRKQEPADADALWEIEGDAAQNRWTTRVYEDRAAFDADRGARAASDLVAYWDGRFAGVLMVAQKDAWSQAEVSEQAKGQLVELGWRVATWAQGRGLATELAREGLAIASEMGVHRVEASCFIENAASWRVMEKVGMRRESHTVKESLHRDGTWHDGLTYAALTEELRARS